VARGRRQFCFWRAGLLLLVVGVLSGPRVDATQVPQTKTSPKKTTAKKTSVKSKPKVAQAGDVKDTHQRLKRIYKRFGIRREAPDAPKWNTGCGGGERTEKKGGGIDMVPSSPPTAIPAWLGYILIGSVVVSLLVFVFLGMRSGERDARPLPSILDEEDDDTGEVLYRPWRVTLDECRRLAGEGNLIAAFAALHRLLLLALQERGDLRLDKTTTNWQYVRRLTSRPKLRRLLSDVTIAAERSVFGEHHLTATEYQGLEGRVQEEVLNDAA
jgi:hypothetical protein